MHLQRIDGDGDAKRRTGIFNSMGYNNNKKKVKGGEEKKRKTTPFFILAVLLLFSLSVVSCYVDDPRNSDEPSE